MSELRQLIALREVAKLHVKQWTDKAKTEAMDALFHKDPKTRADAMNRCSLRQGMGMEATFWLDMIQSAINEELGPKSTTVDKQAEATAAAVVLGEEQRRFKCPMCNTWYDYPEAIARMLVCCGVSLHDKTSG